MKNFSNKYIFIYSIILVAVVAVLLSVVAMSLKSRQQMNKDNEKMQNLLAAIGLKDVKASDAAATYAQYFDRELTVNMAGEIVSEYDIKSGEMVKGNAEQRAFVTDLKAQQLLGEQGAFPIYTFTKDGESGYVVPVRGAGLWGAVWGNVALASDFNTVIGVTFDHESETPGLGAEITTEKFQAPFAGKQILDENGQVVSIRVKKHADAENIHEVDAITGGTMTSNGMDAMLTTDLPRYQKFIDSVRNLVASEEVATVEEAAEESETNNVEEE